MDQPQRQAIVRTDRCRLLQRPADTYTQAGADRGEAFGPAVRIIKNRRPLQPGKDLLELSVETCRQTIAIQLIKILVLYDGFHL